MPPARTTQPAKAALERRPAAPTTIQRSAVAAAPSPARALQQRLGNRATQNLISRAIAVPAREPTTVAPAVSSVSPQTVQLSSKSTPTPPPKVSRPSDPAEREAEEMAQGDAHARAPGRQTGRKPTKRL